MRNGHGDDLHRYEGIKANFSSNVTSLTSADDLRAYLREQIDCIASYPDPTASSLARALASHHRLSEEEILVTSGATEAIYLLAQTYRSRTHYYGPRPTFSEYRDAGGLFAQEQCQLTELDPQEHQRPGLYWLCSPNNPTGEVYPLAELQRLWRSYPNLYFVIDSSYSYFTEAELPDPQATLELFPNVIFVASLTKRYAMPGLRLGYILARREVIQELSAYAPPWSVSSLAIAAGEWIVKEGFPDLLDKGLLFSECRRLWQAIDQLPHFRPCPTETHFFLVHCDHPSIPSGGALKTLLARRYGLLVRDATNFGYSEPTIRIATQRPEENDLLIEALTDISSSTTLPCFE
nr:aminotransferase class I/II-fold pyridoxal phosphate-dependent enzyme [uncultured Porphyromonas sp.]